MGFDVEAGTGPLPSRPSVCGLRLRVMYGLNFFMLHSSFFIPHFFFSSSSLHGYCSCERLSFSMFRLVAVHQPANDVAPFHFFFVEFLIIAGVVGVWDDVGVEHELDDAVGRDVAVDADDVLHVADVLRALVGELQADALLGQHHARRGHRDDAAARGLDVADDERLVARVGRETRFSSPRILWRTAV